MEYLITITDNPVTRKCFGIVLMIRINLITKTGNSLIKATQIFIYFRKMESISIFWLWLSDAHYSIIDRILYLLTVFANNKIIVLVNYYFI